jgi:hypothetical protein
MSGIAAPAGRTRKRHPVRRIVLIGLVLAALAEPVVMYQSLMRERELRQLSAGHALEVDAP